MADSIFAASGPRRRRIPTTCSICSRAFSGSRKEVDLVDHRNDRQVVVDRGYAFASVCASTPCVARRRGRLLRTRRATARPRRAPVAGVSIRFGCTRFDPLLCTAASCSQLDRDARPARAPFVEHLLVHLPAVTAPQRCRMRRRASSCRGRVRDDREVSDETLIGHDAEIPFEPSASASARARRREAAPPRDGSAGGPPRVIAALRS